MVRETLPPRAVALAADAFMYLPTPIAIFSGSGAEPLWNDAWRHVIPAERQTERPDFLSCLALLGVEASRRSSLMEELAEGCPLEAGPEVTVILPQGRQRVWQFGATRLPDAALCIVTIDVTDRRREEEEAERMAYLDALTGRPNRRLFDDRLNQAIERLRRGNDGFAVHFLDLDRFKLVNDSLGHAAGDRLLQQVARRLAHCVRRSDTVARFGGDEFGVIQTDIATEEAAAALAGKLTRQLARPFHIGDSMVETGASIGVAVAFQPGDLDGARLMQAADIALYRVKQSGRGTYAFATVEEAQTDAPGAER